MSPWNSFAAFVDQAERTNSDDARQVLVDQLMAERPSWPWIEGKRATFVYNGSDAQRVALNLDTIPGDPPFAPFNRLNGTTLWYVSRDFETDDLLDYMLAVNDPMTPLTGDPDVVGRVTSFWRVDPLNPTRMNTPQMNVSVLKMPDARPFPDWAAFGRVPHGRVDELTIDSIPLNANGRRVWVYTPAGYDNSGQAYPLLVMHDGQWAAGPLQMPQIADTLIKHGRMRPAVIAMLQSGAQDERMTEYVGSDRHYQFLLTELLPLVQTRYRIDSAHITVGGVAMGAVAAAHAALTNPAVFTGLLMISPPFGKGPMQEQLTAYPNRFENAERLPKRIFQSVGRYEARGRFVKPAQRLRDLFQRNREVDYQFVELGSGHGLVGFRSVLPEALAWVLPG